MSQAGYTPIQLYYSTTAAATPSAGNLAAGELAVNITDGKLFYKDNGGVVRVLATAAGSAGDVVGPGSSTDNALVRFDGTTGKLVQSSVGVLSDAGALSGLTSVAATTFTGTLTGNASTATTLQTSRTIWGQSFDGSANVTGALTGVTDLTASGSLTLNGGTANGVPYLNGSKVLTSGSALTFDGTNLGVGTGTPFVSAAGRGNISINGSTDSILAFGSAGVNTGYLYATTSGLELSSIGNTFVRFSTNGSEQMRLTSTGLGIGTSSPNYSLTSYKGGAVANYLQVASGATGAGSGNGLLLGVDASGNGVINAQGAVNLYTYVAGVLRSTLDSSGNLGLGVTPSASTRGKGFDIGLTGGLYGDGITVNFSTHLTNNAYPLANGNWVYKNSSQVAQRYSMESSGQHLWYTAPSGTAGNAISFTQAMTLDASGNLVLGATSANARLDVVGGSIRVNEDSIGTKIITVRSNFAGIGPAINVTTSDPLLFLTANTERARIDSSGNLLVGTTSDGAGIGAPSRLAVRVTSGYAAILRGQQSGNAIVTAWNSSTAGDGVFHEFGTETSYTVRGTISFNRTAGLTAYNTTSDYRAKDIIGPVADSGALIDSVPVYMGKMKGATQERPMFIAHEVPAYANTGEKDAVDAKGNPVYQQMDASALVPVMWAEIQSLRKRLAAAGI